MGSTPAAGIDYTASGTGPTLLFVPGSYSTPAAWKPIQRLLPTHWRCVATSLCGYGQTLETRNPTDSGMAHELRVLVSVARRVPGPVHLAGHSFGGIVALALAPLPPCRQRCRTTAGRRPPPMCWTGTVTLATVSRLRN